MYVVMGANGKTGGAVARILLDRELPVRVVLRPGRSGEEWKRLGAEAVHADVRDAEALTRAFAGARAAYVLNPPDYAADDMLASARAVAGAYATAIAASGTRAVALSSIGAQHAQGTGNIVTTHVLERALAPVGASFVRAGNFMTNWLPALPAVREGVLPSFFTPLDRPVPHVAVADIATTVVRELERGDSRTVELAAAADYSPDDVAAACAGALGRPVAAQAVERGRWHRAHADMGLPPAAIGNWLEMWEGFNSGHIRFENTPERGRTTLEDFVGAAVARADADR
ncbi:NmrA family NAD(P)-binding protein [Streptomyces sp. NPDC090085]|uniref:NmrA family NAD(P)-binding protein n=1 Tax=unclassified Streptomyces TaxID=2593676 RepID=UPI003429F08F